MEINATLLVQMLNFLVVYTIMDRIVLRLAVALVRAEDRRLGTLEAEAAEHEQRIAVRMRYNDDDWVILQKRLQSECPSPSIGAHPYVVEEPSSPLVLPSQEYIEQEAKRLTKSLVSTVLKE